MPFKLEMFSDFVCPFCYIGFETARRLKPEFGFKLDWRGFQIHPDWPAEGIPAERVYGHLNGDQRRAAWERIDVLARDIGLEMRPPSVLTNSRIALEAVEFARDTGIDDERLEEALYRAYFVDGKNIGDPKIVEDAAVGCGIDRAALTEALKSGKYSLRLRDNAHDAQQRDVTGVPTFFIGEFPLVGAQSIDVMRAVLTRAVERFSLSAE